ncbi:hypothetical protein AB0N05_12440 [Nocardia sp. NPDC051030]|uniref:hypothetical protein n=1 Tax=Nocardia sp. NPDC051030 TaxID=3155162 RepID=UPI00341E699E
MTRTLAVGFSIAALLVELGWLVFAHGSVGAIIAVVLASVAALAVTAARVVAINTVVRILVGALFAGSVADRFGLLGAPGVPGVSWGDYAAFIDYTRSLLPSALEWAAPSLGAVATLAESVLAVGLILGIATRAATTAAAALLLSFAAVMWTSVGFGEVCSYGVLVVAGGSAILATCATALRLDRVFRRSSSEPTAVDAVS